MAVGFLNHGKDSCVRVLVVHPVKRHAHRLKVLPDKIFRRYRVNIINILAVPGCIRLPIVEIDNGTRAVRDKHIAPVLICHIRSPKIPKNLYAVYFPVAALLNMFHRDAHSQPVSLKFILERDGKIRR